MKNHLWVLLLISACLQSLVHAADCEIRPPAGSPSGLYKDGTKLCWNRKPVRMVGYYSIDLATRDNYDYSKFLNTIRFVDDPVPSKRHGVNFTRIWAMGTADTPSCNHTPADLDPAQPSMTMPFTLVPGESCSARNPYPKYNLCVGSMACAQGAGLNPAFRDRLQNILREARKNGILVELVLFDAYFLGRRQESRALYANNPWNPLNNNMDEPLYRRFPGDQSYSSCNKLYRSTDTSDIGDDAFPEFYDVCSDTSSSRRCDKTLNCLGLIQKAYVQAVVDLVRNTPGGSDNLFFEVMNRSRFDKRDSGDEGFDMAKFKRWNDVVGYWIKCRSGNDCRSTRGDYLVMAEVGIAEYSDLACTDRAKCPGNPQDIFALPNIDLVDFQGYTWESSTGAPGPCGTARAALKKYKNPVVIDTDSAWDRIDKCVVQKWATEMKSCGNPGETHFIQLDGMTFGYPEPKGCTFRGIGNQKVNLNFDERYLDCHTLDTIADGAPTYLSDIVTTAPPVSCPSSVNLSGQPVWCASACN